MPARVTMQFHVAVVVCLLLSVGLPLVAFMVTVIRKLFRRRAAHHCRHRRHHHHHCEASTSSCKQAFVGMTFCFISSHVCVCVNVYVHLFAQFLWRQQTKFKTLNHCRKINKYLLGWFFVIRSIPQLMCGRPPAGLLPAYLPDTAHAMCMRVCASI